LDIEPGELMRKPRYWIVASSEDVSERIRKGTLRDYGFDKKHKERVKEVRSGDLFLCYVKKAKKFIGILRITSPFYWDDGETDFPCRVGFKKVVMLTPDTAVPIDEMKDRLSFRGRIKNPQNLGLFLMPSPREWAGRDGKLVAYAIQNRPEVVSQQKLVNQVVSQLRKEIRSLPEGFYDTFDYTTTGQCYTHPITLALLCKILTRLEGVQLVAIDLHLKNESGKCQPDVVGLSRLTPRPEPVVFVDYESPDSCDLRITWKDVGQYNRWSKGHGKRVPYLIITTLPNRKADWRLPYTAKGYVNRQFRKKKATIFRNPCRFWYGQFWKELKSENLSGIYFINIDGRHVKCNAL
jgi:hypothetical protein